MSKLKTVVRWLAFCAHVGVLAGCVAAPIAVEQKLTGDEGAVVFRLITNGQEGSEVETLYSVSLQQENYSGTVNGVKLLRTRAMTNTTAVFSGMVAPGRYKVLSAEGSQGNSTYTFPLSNMLSSFEVKKGEISVLGTLLVQPLEGSRFILGHVPSDAEMEGTVEQLFPALVEQTVGRPVHTFEWTPEMKRRAELAPRIKRLAVASNLYGLRVEDNGQALAGSRMGQILWRKAGERGWRTLDVGSWKAVLSVRPYRNGLLAAGEEGLLRYSSDEGKTWAALKPPAVGVLAAVEPLPNGKVLAMVRRDAEWDSYVTDNALTGPWRKLASFAEERSLNVDVKNGASIAVASGNRVGVMMRNGEFLAVDGDTGALTRSSTGQSMQGISVMPDGMLVMRGITMLRTTLVSTDAGKNWSELKTNRFVSAIAFASPQKIYAVGPISPGITAGEYALMRSSDGGRTWVQSGEVPGGTPINVVQLVVDRSGGALLAFLRNGNILRSGDEGKTWTRDF